jgi:hypothetical protein
MSVRLPGRAAAAAVSLLLTASLGLIDDGTALAAPAAKSPRAKTAAAWLDSQVSRGRIHNGEFNFDDWGLTIDTALALTAAGGHHKTRRHMTRAIRRHYFTDYATFSGHGVAGSMAKSLVAAEVLGKNPRTFGGHNVRREVLALVAPASAGFEAGRVRDGGASDFSNTFAQAYATIGLARSGKVPQRIVDYLLKQQCSGGYFRLTEVAGSTCDQSRGKPDVDATALAVQGLLAATKDGAAVPPNAVRRATRWLADAQRKNGSWTGGTTTRGPNTNSTGLAAQALRAAHGHRAEIGKAAAYVKRLQLTRKRAHGPAAKDIGAIAYNREGLRSARDGIQKVERDQFRRATAQAIFALVPKPLTVLRAP